MGFSAALVAASVISAGASVYNAKKSRQEQRKAMRQAEARQAKLDAIPKPDAEGIADSMRRRQQATTGRTSTIFTEGLGG